MDDWIVLEEKTVGAISIRLLAGSALRALKGAGASERTLKVYECTGFGELCRQFEARGASEYSPELADVVVREVWADFERGALSSWKWTAVRRGAALLDVFHRTGSVDLPPLSPWKALRLPPTPRQLADPGNLHALVWAAQERLRELGVSAKTLQHYRYDGFDPIVRAHHKQGLTRYSAAVTAELVDRSRALLEQKAMRPSVWRNVRKCAAVLDELSRTGGLRRRRLPRWGLRHPGEAFDAALEGFCVEAGRLGWGEGTVDSARSAVRQFLFAVEDAGITTVSGITSSVVSDAVTAVAQRRHGGLASWLFAIKAFLRHLHDAGTTRGDLSVSVPGLAARRRVVREGFAAQEVRTLLAATVGDSIMQKRDRAIMMLAAQTGLRAGDLARLERSDIDWRANEIRLVQAKTGQVLCLPLGTASGNVIADYLLNYRIPGDSPFLFVCCTGPIRPLGARTVSAVVTRYIRRCGLVGRVPRRGAHSFRRGLGTRLLEAEVSIDTLRQVLGHMHIDSARPYLSVSEAGLKDCAISLAAAVQAGESR
jgi:site-specific recombinase XerD